MREEPTESRPRHGGSTVEHARPGLGAESVSAGAPSGRVVTTDHTWRVAERASGGGLAAVERRVTGPEEWVVRHGNPHANPTTSR